MAPWLLDAIAAFGWVISVPKDWPRSWCDGSRSNIDTLQWLETAGRFSELSFGCHFTMSFMFCDFLSTRCCLLFARNSCNWWQALERESRKNMG